MVEKELLKRIITELLDGRMYEAGFIDQGTAFFKGYTMALEDVWHRLYGTELDLGREDNPYAPTDKVF